MMKTAPSFSIGNWLRQNRASLLVLLAAALLFAALRFFLQEPPAPQIQAGDYAEYEKGTVVSVLSDSTFSDEASDGGWRGEQMLTARVLTGRYAGETLLCYNYVGPLYGVPVRVAIEVISSLSSSIGMILAIPITAVISSGLVSRGSKEDKA